MDIATTTPDAMSSATWLPPDNASAPKTLITTTRTDIRKIKGIRETIHEGFSPLLKNFIINQLTYTAAKKHAKLTNNVVITLNL